MVQTTVDLRIGGDHFQIRRDRNTGVMLYFVNGQAVTVTGYLARMQHYREIELQRLFGRLPPSGLRRRATLAREERSDLYVTAGVNV
jgi:hypothetical protein